MRKTKQKKLLNKKVEEQTGFFTAQELLDQVQKEDPSMGIATIYRYLKRARQEHKLHTYTCDRHTIYSQKALSHCHFIDEKTGKTVHFSIPDISFLKKYAPGKICHVQVEIHGTLDQNP